MVRVPCKRFLEDVDILNDVSHPHFPKYKLKTKITPNTFNIHLYGTLSKEKSSPRTVITSSIRGHIESDVALDIS